MGNNSKLAKYELFRVLCQGKWTVGKKGGCLSFFVCRSSLVKMLEVALEQLQGFCQN